MTTKRQDQIERLLRAARKNVYENAKYTRIIAICKMRLDPTYRARSLVVWEKRNQYLMM